MDVLITLSILFLALVMSIYHGIPLLFPLLFGLILFIAISLRRGYSIPGLGQMIAKGSKKSLVVIKIFVLIGALTAVWRACGTVAFIVFYGIELLNATFFILFSFLLSSLVSFLLGTSFGTAATIGVVLAVLAKSGNVDINVAAGAIIAGAYFGDRCSPMSSSANLVATLTGTDLYTNLRNMWKTSLLPFALSVIGYAVLSYFHPLTAQNNTVTLEITALFQLDIIVAAPAILILAASAFKVDVKLSMLLSILSGIWIGVSVQGHPIWDMLRYILWGFTLDQSGMFASIIQGGGLLSMVNVALIVFISSAYSGIFEGTGLLREVELLFASISQKIGIFATTILTSITTSAFACNQTLAIILTNQFAKNVYERRQLSNYRLALDLENTVIVIAPLIPWNIASAFPLAALSADADSLLYAFYLFLVPLANLAVRAART